MNEPRTLSQIKRYQIESAKEYQKSYQEQKALINEPNEKDITTKDVTKKETQPESQLRQRKFTK